MAGALKRAKRKRTREKAKKPDVVDAVKKEGEYSLVILLLWFFFFL